MHKYGPDCTIWGDRTNLVAEYFSEQKQFFTLREETLLDLNNILGLETIVFFKTLYQYPRVTSDLDILVDDIPNAVRKLTKGGWTAGKYQHGNVHLKKNDRIKVGVHKIITWGTSPFMDNDLPWKTRKKTEIDGLELYTAGHETDLMAILAHIPFEKLYWDLGELLYIFNISTRADWKLILGQAQKYRWGNTLKNMLSIANGFHKALYNSESPFPGTIICKHPNEPVLPSELPLRIAIAAHIEKRAWSKIRDALFGFHIRYVISGRKERRSAE